MLGVHRFRGRTSEMRSELDAVDESLSGRPDVSPAEHFAGEAAFWLARAYADLARPAEAAETFERARSILSRSPPALGGRWLAAIPAQQ